MAVAKKAAAKKAVKRKVVAKKAKTAAVKRGARRKVAKKAAVKRKRLKADSLSKARGLRAPAPAHRRRARLKSLEYRPQSQTLGLPLSLAFGGFEAFSAAISSHSAPSTWSSAFASTERSTT